MFRKLLPAVVPLLLVAACGSDASDAVDLEAASPIAAIQQAPDAAAKAGSAHVELAMTMATPRSDTPVAIKGSGDYDTEAGVVAMQLDLGKVLSQFGGLGGKDAPAGFDKPMRFVMDGTTAYIDLPLLAAFTSASGWLSVPLDKLDESGLGDLGGVGAGTDPTAMLDYLRGAGEVKEVGHEKIGGVDTVKYTAAVDLDKALAKVPADQRKELQAKIDDLGATLEELPITVWIDGDGLPRRMEVTTDVPKVGKSAMTLTWSKYGEPVSVDVPDPADVTPLADVLGDAAKGFLGRG